MKHLVPCPECNRHVRVSELECPFCAVPLDLANTPAPQLPRSRLSRAATLAFGATFVSATALAACSDDGGAMAVYGAPSGEGAGAAGTAGTADGGRGGGPSQPSGGQSGVAGAPNMGGGGAVVIYGGPPGEDAGMGGAVDLAGAAGTGGEAGAGGDKDNTGGKGGGAVAVYGGPP